MQCLVFDVIAILIQDYFYEMCMRLKICAKSLNYGFNFLAAVLVVIFAVQGVLADSPGSVAVINMKMMILPGTQSYLDESIERATEEGAKALVIVLDTPGGILFTTQDMIQSIFKSKVPVVVYVSGTGAMATSAGVFITMAGHVAAMAPGTSMGAAHPVQISTSGTDEKGQDSQNEKDMRAKAENATVAMIRSIAEQRGRNTAWVEKAVRESVSITEKEAVQLKVVDYIAEDLDQLLRQMKGKVIKLDNKDFVLGDYSNLPKTFYQMSYKQEALNFFANPTVLALLTMAATTGIAIELYNPGLIFPGVVGLTCLIIVLAVQQVLPFSLGAVILVLVGAAFIFAELFIPSGILGIGGVICMTLGALYLVDVTAAPGLSVALEVVLPIILIILVVFMWLLRELNRAYKHKPDTGLEALIGMHGKAQENISKDGSVFVNGEIWKACAKEGIIAKGANIEVTGILEGLVLEVKGK